MCFIISHGEGIRCAIRFIWLPSAVGMYLLIVGLDDDEDDDDGDNDTTSAASLLPRVARKRVEFFAYETSIRSYSHM